MNDKNPRIQVVGDNPKPESVLSDQCCGSCFYSKYPDTKADSIGVCRANPPQVIPIPQQGLRGMVISVQGAFPPVARDGWCGMWVNAIETDDLPAFQP